MAVKGEAPTVTRRDALRWGSGAALAVVLGATGGRAVAAAQPASPASSPTAGDGLANRYAVVRLRKLTPGTSADELNALIREGFLPRVAAIPGFVSYLAVANEASGDQFSVGIFADQAGADASSRLAADWGASNGAFAYVAEEPLVAAGVIDLAVAPPQHSSPAATPATDGGLDGRYVVVRLRRLRTDRSAAELVELIRDGVLPPMATVPGLVSYVVVVDAVTLDQFAVGIYADRAGAEESTRLAAEWGASSGANDYVEGDPIVVEGDIDLAVVATAAG